MRGGFTEYTDADAYTPEAYDAEGERVVDMGFDAIKFATKRSMRLPTKSRR